MYSVAKNTSVTQTLNLDFSCVSVYEFGHTDGLRGSNLQSFFCNVIEVLEDVEINCDF